MLADLRLPVRQVDAHLLNIFISSAFHIEGVAAGGVASVEEVRITRLRPEERLNVSNCIMRQVTDAQDATRNVFKSWLYESDFTYSV